MVLRMTNTRRGIVMVVAGLVVLACNVVDASNDGVSGWNLVTIATGVFLLFYGFTTVAKGDQ
jgi:hypothetical protein